jgi:hypothetical protein
MPDPTTSPEPFNVKFNFFPPDLQAKLWLLGLDANTSKVNIAYSPGSFVTSLAYSYGGNAQACLGIQRFTTTIGVDPASGDVDLSLVYRGFKFGSSASATQKSACVDMDDFANRLLPFPRELSSIFGSAAGGLQSMAGDISSAPNNPLAWYRLHSNDFTTIHRAYETAKQIQKFGTDPNRFSIGLYLKHSPQSGLTVYGGAQLRF